jgi:hypothetical protein
MYLLCKKLYRQYLDPLPYRNTLRQGLEPCIYRNHPAAVPFSIQNVFSYGRGVRERSEFYRLKAGYFTLKFHPHMVHSVRFELTPHRLRAEYATVNASCGWIRNCFLLRAI